MKTFIIIFLSIWCLTSCGPSQNEIPGEVKSDSTEYHIHRLDDGCQYIHFGGGSGTEPTHYGLCDNPLHKVNGTTEQ
jgi:hypothetical protein